MSKLVDMTFGINRQAMAVLHYLDCYEIDETAGQIFYTTTAPWYNGRERGIVLQVKNPINYREALCIAFFEHRNSDSICALKWIGQPDINPPCLLSDGKLAYPTDNKWNDIAHTEGCGRAYEMADWIWSEVENYCDAIRESAAANPKGLLK